MGGKGGKGKGKGCCKGNIWENFEILEEVDDCCDNKLYDIELKQSWCPIFYFAAFENYKTMIELSMEQATLNGDCRKCADVPSSLYTGLQSEFCYDDYFDSVSKLGNHPCKCLPLRDVNLCKLKSGKLYPYGYFNNNNPNINRDLLRRVTLKCDKKKLCPTYIYCKCPPNAINCKCCDYTVTFPYQDKFISYKISGCNDKLYDFINNKCNNPNKTYQHYIDGVSSDQQFENLAIESFSRNYII